MQWHALEGDRRLTRHIEDVEVAEPNEDQDGVEAGGHVEREEHGGASRKAVARQWDRSKMLTSRRMWRMRRMRRMPQMLTLGPRRRWQGKLSRANGGIGVVHVGGGCQAVRGGVQAHRRLHAQMSRIFPQKPAKNLCRWPCMRRSAQSRPWFFF